MPKATKVNAPLFRILRCCAPVVNEALTEFAAARALDSDGGSKVTLMELQSLGLEIGFKVGSIVAKELGRANADIVEGGFHDGN